jgi:large subunit ribosomal protein L25
MSENAMSAELRQGTGKGVARKLRAQGRLPAVLYAHGKETLSITVDPHRLERLLATSDAGINTLIDLAGDGGLGGRTVMVKEIQRDPVKGHMLHADLFEVDLTETITVHVPVHLVGMAKGVKFGGIVDHALRELELDCLPRSIPDEILLDVSELDIGDSLHVRDLALPAGVELRTDPDVSVVSVVAPAVEEEAEAPEEGVVAAAEGEPAEAPEREGESAGEESDEG